jgi:hypothetical protein
VAEEDTLSDDPYERAEQLISMVAYVRHGETQYTIASEAVAAADESGDFDLQRKARMEFITAAQFSGRTDEGLVAFTWCLSHYDSNPQRFDEREVRDLMWKMKWMATALPRFPTVSRERIEAMLADMERRFTAYNVAPQLIHHKRRTVALDMGDFAKAEEAHREFMQLPRGNLSDCEACVASANVDYHVAFGRNVLAVKAAKPILEGRLYCAEVPHVTLAALLRPMLKLGRRDEAMLYHRRGLAMIRDNPNDFVTQFGEHAVFLALTDNFAPMIRLIQRTIPLAIESTDPLTVFNFLLNCSFSLGRFQAHTGRNEMTLAVPKEHALFREKGKIPIRETLDWVDNQLRELANAFDSRNGNTYYRNRIAESRDWEQLATVMPVPAEETEDS